MRGLLVLTVVGGSVAHATLTPLVSVRGEFAELGSVII